MNFKTVFSLVGTTFLAIAIFCSVAVNAQESGSSLVGTPTTNFSLSSSQDRLISYGKEYYGNYNLILTFFPAAFTPV